MKIGLKKAYDCSTLTKHYQDLEFLISCWSVESCSFLATWAKSGSGPTPEDMMSLTALPLYEETNTIRLVPGEEDKGKLQRMSSSMASSKMSGNSTYASHIRYFGKGKGSQVGLV